MAGTRRDFVRKSTGFSVLGLAGKTLPAASRPVSIRVDKEVTGTPVTWAVGHLEETLKAKGALTDAKGTGNAFVVSVSTARHPLTVEAFRMAPGASGLSIAASDDRGFVYALLELADRVRYGADPVAALSLPAAIEERPANRIRSIARAFVSDVEDKAWYYDRDFWREYLTMLAANRFNRFNLTFGLGYDFPRKVTGDYLHFPYPYLLEVPGYDVRPVPLPPGERERNLEALKFISEETARRGLLFQIAIWTHAYQWTDSPNAQHRIEGLTPETHAAYCRQAMSLLLKTCPAIQGVTMRVHGESGIPEGSLPFWKEVFAGIVSAGRPIEIDMHAKGLDPEMVEMALNTGLPVNISPKYWAEHMGLGYHQAGIRELEMPKPLKNADSTFKLSEGSRSFLRYGYGDLFTKNRRYDVTFRIWPGTQRLLLWGDPALAAAYGRASSFMGAKGIEICEPLFFKGRQGSGLPGGRCAYLDESLNPRLDFEKYEYTYRVWGRLLYNPQTPPDGWQRYLRAGFGPAALAIEEALANGSRVLPLFTTARLPSASNLGCWPEIYTNMPIVEGSEPSPYGDTAVPKRFGTVIPLDPQLFSTIEEHTEELLSGKNSGRYSPIEVAQWFEDMTDAADRALSEAASHASKRSADFRRVQEDVVIEIGLGRFFAAQIRSATLFDIYRETGDPAALHSAIEYYQRARAAWATMAERASKIYRPDLTFGDMPVRRGHWKDRLPGIDRDLAAMENLKSGNSAPEKKSEASAYIQKAVGRPMRDTVALKHRAAPSFQPGTALQVLFAVPSSARITAGRLHYRQVTHGERWKVVDMMFDGKTLGATIPGDYTRSEFALQYYVEVQGGANTASLFPGLDIKRGNQPYFVIPQSS